MEIKHPLGQRHETDMIAPSLALANNNIDIESIRDDRFRTDTWTENAEIPEGTIVHYGWDFKNYKHLGVEFGKHEFAEYAPWQGNIKKVREWRENATYEWTKNFFTDMLNIHQDFPNILRTSTKPTDAHRV